MSFLLVCKPNLKLERSDQLQVGAQSGESERVGGIVGPVGPRCGDESRRMQVEGRSDKSEEEDKCVCARRAGEGRMIY